MHWPLYMTLSAVLHGKYICYFKYKQSHKFIELSQLIIILFSNLLSCLIITSIILLCWLPVTESDVCHLPVYILFACHMENTI